MFRKLGLMLFAVMMAMSLAPMGADAGNGNGRGNNDDGYESSTTVPGQQGREGVVTGTYTVVDGECVVQVIYRGDFGGTPYLDNGWIINNANCTADDGSTYTEHYLIVHESDHRYTGNPDWAIWGSWEIVGYTRSGEGNMLRPYDHVANNE